MSLYDTGIRPLVDDYLIQEAKKVRDYGDYWSASSAGYCMRKNIFDRFGLPPVTEDARKQRVFTSGHIFHEWIQGITKAAGLSIAQELELQDETLMIRGHIDDLVWVKEMGELEAMPADRSGDNPLPVHNIKQHLILYDYKTQNSRAFDYKRPMSQYHKMQLGTYMYMLRNEREAGLKKRAAKATTATEISAIYSTMQLTEARILKISKDDLRMSEEQLLWTPALEKEVVGYWRTLNGYWKAKTIPKCTCADYEGGFMSREAYNPYFYNGEPCSIEYYNNWKSRKDKP